jgi:predicted MFS family arabinose efflux permease
MAPNETDSAPAEPRAASNENAPGTWGELLRGRQGIITLTLNLGIMLFAIDTFVVTTVMPGVVSEIGGSAYYAWTVMMYVVGSIIGSASSGPIRGMFGRREGYLIAGLGFAAGLIGAALAQTMIVLALWRLLQGIGGGLIISQSFAITSDLYRPQLRTRVFASISTTWGFGTVFGPAIGGLFAEFLSWRWAFWGLVPFCALFGTMVWRMIPRSPGHGSFEGFPFGRLGLLAAGVMSIGITSQADGVAARIALFVVAFPLVAFAVRLDGRAETKMLPTRPLTITTPVGSAYWVVILQTIAFTAINLFTTLYLQVLHGLPPLAAGYIYAVFGFCWTVSSLIVAGWRGSWVWVAVWGGLVMIVIGVIGISFFAVPGPVWLIASCLACVGLGIGASNNHLIALSMISAVKGEEALTASSFQTVRTLGIAFGSAGAGMIANFAGMSTGVSADVVAHAVTVVNHTDIGIAVLALAAGLPLFLTARKRAQIGS